jgi:hypothetical protein
MGLLTDRVRAGAGQRAELGIVAKVSLIESAELR